MTMADRELPRSSPDAAVSQREAMLADTFVHLADTLTRDFDVVEFLDGLTTRCVTLLDVAQAGLMLAGPDGTLRAMAASDQQVQLLELFQLQASQGPCLDAYTTGEVVSSPDLSDEGRWPRFAQAASRTGFRSVTALPMRLRTNVIGALNLFHGQPGTLTDPDLHLGQALANIATIGLLHQRGLQESQELAGRLQTALNSRVLIEQAKGMVAQQGELDVDEAFDRIRHHTRTTSRLLRDVADDIVKGDLTADDLTA